ncbi:hypothetical protein O9992_15230 [Vibrio lentus]|nr:hypothetical protein [Vibrio lentus]
MNNTKARQEGANLTCQPYVYLLQYLAGFKGFNIAHINFGVIGV